MNQFGEVGSKVTLTLNVARVAEYTMEFGWSVKKQFIYIMRDGEQNEFVWKTSTYPGVDTIEDDGSVTTDFVREHDTIEIKGTIKEYTTYKGKEQTVLTRCKVISIKERAKTKTEMDAEKASQQLASLIDEDFTWKMPYRQYKEHYSDCETLAGSFHYERQEAMITVIIRTGRLKASGTRGKFYSIFELANEKGKHIFVKAISWQTAWKQVKNIDNSCQWEMVDVRPYKHEYCD